MKICVGHPAEALIGVFSDRRAGLWVRSRLSGTWSTLSKMAPSPSPARPTCVLIQGGSGWNRWGSTRSRAPRARAFTAGGPRPNRHGSCRARDRQISTTAPAATSRHRCSPPRQSVGRVRNQGCVLTDGRHRPEPRIGQWQKMLASRSPPSASCRRGILRAAQRGAAQQRRARGSACCDVLRCCRTYFERHHRRRSPAHLGGGIRMSQLGMLDATGAHTFARYPPSCRRAASR